MIKFYRVTPIYFFQQKMFGSNLPNCFRGDAEFLIVLQTNGQTGGQQKQWMPDIIRKAQTNSTSVLPSKIKRLHLIPINNFYKKSIICKPYFIILIKFKLQQ